MFSTLPSTSKVSIQYGTPTDQIKAENEARKQKMRETLSRLNRIEEKSECGGVKFLDWFASTLDSIANFFHNSAERVRNRTTKISAPCLIKFHKK